jgi:hypothetical protein
MVVDCLLGDVKERQVGGWAVQIEEPADVDGHWLLFDIGAVEEIK